MDDVGNHNLRLSWLNFCHQDWVLTALAINKKAQSYLLSQIYINHCSWPQTLQTKAWVKFEIISLILKIVCEAVSSMREWSLFPSIDRIYKVFIYRRALKSLLMKNEWWHICHLVAIGQLKWPLLLLMKPKLITDSPHIWGSVEVIEERPKYP